MSGVTQPIERWALAGRARAGGVVAIVLLAAACGSGGSRAAVSPTALRPAAALATAEARQQAARLGATAQQASSHPLVDAESPNLQPAGGALSPVQVATSGSTAGAIPPGAALNLPAGFQASVYAVTGGGPRFMAVSPAGDVYVTLQGKGEVVRLADQGGYATVQTVIGGLNQPHGIAFHDGYLYVGETNQIDRYTYADGAIDGRSQQVVVPNLPTGGHITRTVDFGPDGLMYVSVGSSCNVCIDKNPVRAAITVYNPDGSDGRAYASGLRNAVGFTWQPDTGDLWATVNGRDQIGQDMGLPEPQATQTTDNLPPDYVTTIAQGGNYGWPRCYGDHQLDPKFGDPTFCAAATPPTVELQAHSAPLGLAFYTSDAFPADYQGSLFVAMHGSWDRQNPTGYKVVRVVFQGGQPVGVEDFATGWHSEPGASWGRPTGVLVAADGSLLVSDDSRGVIYRISYVGERTAVGK